MPSHRPRSGGLPCSAGIGLRSPNYTEWEQDPPPVGWLEIHTENLFHAGTGAVRTVEALRARYPVSFHGVGLSLGSADTLHPDHLHRVRALIDRFEPAMVSEHLAWVSTAGRYLHDLLPLPYTDAMLDYWVDRVDAVQTALRHRLLLENPSAYLQFAESTMTEAEFLSELAARSGCGILLDVNNLYVNHLNHGLDVLAYVAHIPAAAVAEIHLAGYTVETVAGREIIVDTHSAPVAEAVWSLYGEVISQIGPRPTLIERDGEIPPLALLAAEAARAERVLETAHG